ncbi:hypothetical protein ABEB22_05660 [Thioclava sp. 'Guangxiensis']|uniref:hypothetical protein n=1 Tax=Thioclava sp. 'Guangxiensis' TaxID=3149044 RepID=UPI0038783E79
MTDQTSILSPADRVTELVARALGQSRLCAESLSDIVIPELPPTRRLCGEHVLRHLRSRSLFTTHVLDDLESLIRQLNSEISEGSYEVCQPHEGHPDRAYMEVILSPKAKRLNQALERIRALYSTIHSVLDAVEAQRISARLTIDD